MTLWEMFSYGAQPYGDLKGCEVNFHKLKITLQRSFLRLLKKLRLVSDWSSLKNVQLMYTRLCNAAGLMKPPNALRSASSSTRFRGTLSTSIFGNWFWKLLSRELFPNINFNLGFKYLYDSVPFYRRKRLMSI